METKSLAANFAYIVSVSAYILSTLFEWYMSIPQTDIVLPANYASFLTGTSLSSVLKPSRANPLSTLTLYCLPSTLITA